MRVLYLAILGLFVAMLTGCGGGGGSTKSDNTDTRKWTVMVYMAADNNLDPYGVANLNAMESVGSTSDVSVVVQFDRTASAASSTGGWAGARRYYVKKDSDTSTINSTLISSLGTTDMSDPQVLKNFVNWATEAYPAEHYLLVLWDHGDGWQTRAAQRVVRCAFTDWSSGGEMSLPELADTLAECPKSDILLFDACYMGMIEIADAVKNSAGYFVASEASVPGEGQDYRSMLSTLTSNPSISASSLSSAIVNQYAAYYGSGYDWQATMSAVDLSRIDEVVAAADGLSDAIVANLPAAKSAVLTARAASQDFGYDDTSYGVYRDLYDFAGEVKSSMTGYPAITSAAGSLQSAISSAIVNQCGVGQSISGVHGISVYLPLSGGCSSDYVNQQFATDTSWDEMVSSY